MKLILFYPARLGFYACLSLLALTIAACTLPHVQLAEEMVAKQNWDGAVEAYREAVRLDPFNEELQDKLDAVKGRAAEVHYSNGKKTAEGT